MIELIYKLMVKGNSKGKAKRRRIIKERTMKKSVQNKKNLFFCLRRMSNRKNMSNVMANVINKEE